MKIGVGVGVEYVRNVTGGAASLAYALWDPNKLPAGIALSDGDRKATGTAGTWKTLGATKPKSTGKWIFANTLASSGGNAMALGICAGASDGVWPSSLMWSGVGARYTDAIGSYGSNGTVEWSLAGSAGSASGITTWFGNSQICKVHVDLDSVPQTIKWYVSGVMIYSRDLPAGRAWSICASILTTNFLFLNTGQDTLTPELPAYLPWTD